MTPDHPDVTGTYLRHVRRFLNGELGAHVEAMFWEHVPHRLEHGTAPPPDRRRQTAATRRQALLIR